MKDANLAQLWKEMFGDDIFEWHNIKIDITDKPWLEKVEANDEIVSDLCEYYTFDFCK